MEAALGENFEEESEAELEEQNEFEETEFSALEEALGSDSVADDALEDIELSPEEEELLEGMELGPVE